MDKMEELKQIKYAISTDLNKFYGKSNEFR